MKDSLLKTGLIATAAPFLAACGEDTPPDQSPNVVFILADDLGWGDLGCYGQTLFDTPNIDALADGGIRFLQSYAGTTVSAPSRSCLLTGTHSGHTFIRGNLSVSPEGQYPLPEDTPNFFRDFQDAGYATGAFGKWGLGPVGSSGDPGEQGIGEFFGFNCQALAHSYYPDHLWHNAQKVILQDNNDSIPYGQGTYAPDLIHSKALEFMENAVSSGKPFFLWYPTTIPHAELIAPQDSITLSYIGRFPETPYRGNDQGDPYFRLGGYCSQTHPRATFAAMVARLDMYVGQIVAKLEELGVRDNTIIIFSSDNGPHLEGGADPDFFDSNGPWRGYKRDLYEGGIRVPLIINWPGHTDALPRSGPAPGYESDLICGFQDFLPTFRDILDTYCEDDLPDSAGGLDRTGELDGADGLDGISLLPLLEGHLDRQSQHEWLYFELAEVRSQAVRKGPWKLVRRDIETPSDRYELYNLDSDPGETTDLAASMPDIVSELSCIMDSAHVPSTLFPLFRSEIP